MCQPGQLMCLSKTSIPKDKQLVTRKQDSHCPYVLSSETTAEGTGLTHSVEKEDPVDLDSSLTEKT